MNPTSGFTQDDVRKAMVYISPSNEPNTKGLGIICGQFIFTCAHFFESLQIPLSILDVPLFEARRIHDGAEGTLAMYVATSADFMALAADNFFVGMSDGGPTDTAYGVLTDEMGEYNRVQPSALEFGDGCDHQALLPGFMYAPDGQSKHKVELTVCRNSPVISYWSNDIREGCSGGPIFTDDGHLIGINANMGDLGNGNEKLHCLARRIDLCCPQFLHRQIDWRTLWIG